MKDAVSQRSVYTPVALVHGILDQGLVLWTPYSGRLCTATVMRGKVIQPVRQEHPCGTPPKGGAWSCEASSVPVQNEEAVA